MKYSIKTLYTYTNIFVMICENKDMFVIILLGFIEIFETV